MSRHLFQAASARLCFPRVSGDEPQEVQWADEEYQFSPRERG